MALLCKIAFTVALLLCSTAHAQVVIPGAIIRTIATSGGTPTGNTWTVASTNQLNGATILSPAGATGDRIYAWHGWEGGVDVTSITNVTGGGTAALIGSQIDHSNNDLSCRAGVFIAAGTGGITIAATYNTAGAAFQNWVIWRVSVTGTVTDAAVGDTATGTSIVIGPFTTATVNGLVLVGVKPYGATTHNSRLIGGNTPTGTLDVTGTASTSWWYLHVAALTSADATETFGTSQDWVGIEMHLSAQ